MLPVGDFLRSKNVTPEEIYVERGHMDEVFRAITQSTPSERTGASDA